MNGDPIPSSEQQLANLETQLKKQSLAMMQANPIEYISHISIQIATIKTIQHQLEEALNGKIPYSHSREEMANSKVQLMERHIRAAIHMLPQV